MSPAWAGISVLFLAACATGQPAALRATGSPVSAETPAAEVSPVGAALRSDPFEEQASAEAAPPMHHGGHGMQMDEATPAAPEETSEQAQHGEASP
jgi:hypothetical protein